LNGLIAKDDLDSFVEGIVKDFGRKRVKVVVGMKLFKQDLAEIKQLVEDSEHHT